MDYSLRTQSDVYNPGILRVLNACYQKHEPQWQPPIVQAPVQTVHPPPFPSPEIKYEYLYKPGQQPASNTVNYPNPEFRRKYSLPKRPINLYHHPEIHSGPVTYTPIKPTQPNHEIFQQHLLFKE